MQNRIVKGYPILSGGYMEIHYKVVVPQTGFEPVLEGFLVPDTGAGPV